MHSKIVLICLFAACAAGAAFSVAAQQRDSEFVTYEWIRDGIIYEQLLDSMEQELAEIQNNWSERPAIGIYQVDLNGDQIDEIIVAPGDEMYFCDWDTKVCDYYVYARVTGGLQQIADIEAVQLRVSYERKNGVRDLRAYKNINNPYLYHTYTYNRRSFAYELRPE